LKSKNSKPVELETFDLQQIKSKASNSEADEVKPSSSKASNSEGSMTKLDHNDPILKTISKVRFCNGMTKKGIGCKFSKSFARYHMAETGN
jgi:hypothetical protein